MKRGFTMLETLLAAALSALVVLMVIGMFAFMDRSEARQVAKLEQIDALARIHKVMQNTFSMLVVSDQNAQAPTGPGPNAGGSATPSREARVVLGPDPSPTLRAAVRKSKIGGSGPVQRLEVVVEKPPVPRHFAQGMTGTLASSMQANMDPQDDEPLVGQVRGVFELRPDLATQRAQGQKVEALTNQEGDQGWTLWWRPVGQVDDSGETSASVDPLSVDPTEDPGAVPIASGLTQCNWHAFKDRVHLDEIDVTSYVNLPAYMELEVRTVGGFYANWMFEVQWSVAQENTIDQQKKNNQLNNGRAQPIGGAR
jgi:hypothetical protein